MGRHNKEKEKKWVIKEGDTLYYECYDGKVYKTIATAIDGNEVLTSECEWENKRIFLKPGDPKIKECVGFYEPDSV